MRKLRAKDIAQDRFENDDGAKCLWTHIKEEFKGRTEQVVSQFEDFIGMGIMEFNDNNDPRHVVRVWNKFIKAK